MLRKNLITILLTATACAAPLSHAIIIQASASMDGMQVVPGSGSAATGTANFSFNTATNLLDLNATITDIFLPDITFPPGPLEFGVLGPMHIHTGVAGANGGIVVAFAEMAFYTPTINGMTITVLGLPYDPGIIPALLADGLYLQMHTLNVGGAGEIRGQLIVPEPGTLSILAVGLLGLGLARRKKAA